MKTLRMIFVLIGLTVIGGVWQIISFMSENYPIVNYPPRGEKVLALGDSLTAGIGASSPERGYVGVLSERLNISIVNKGVSGNTTLDALARFDADVKEADPDILIILLGGNDYLRRLPPDETFSSLKEIITRAQKEGAVVLLVGIRGGILKDNFSERFAKLARETGSVFVPDALDGIIGDRRLMADEIHPNDAGYLKMADKIAPALQSLVASIKH